MVGGGVGVLVRVGGGAGMGGGAVRVATGSRWRRRDEPPAGSQVRSTQACQRQLEKITAGEFWFSYHSPFLVGEAPLIRLKKTANIRMSAVSLIAQNCISNLVVWFDAALQHGSTGLQGHDTSEFKGSQSNLQKPGSMDEHSIRMWLSDRRHFSPNKPFTAKYPKKTGGWTGRMVLAICYSLTRWNLHSARPKNNSA